MVLYSLGQPTLWNDIMQHPLMVSSLTEHGCVIFMINFVFLCFCAVCVCVGGGGVMRFSILASLHTFVIYVFPTYSLGSF